MVGRREPNLDQRLDQQIEIAEQAAIARKAAALDAQRSALERQMSTETLIAEHASTLHKALVDAAPKHDKDKQRSRVAAGLGRFIGADPIGVEVLPPPRAWAGSESIELVSSVFGGSTYQNGRRRDGFRLLIPGDRETDELVITSDRFDGFRPHRNKYHDSWLGIQRVVVDTGTGAVEGELLYSVSLKPRQEEIREELSDEIKERASAAWKRAMERQDETPAEVPRSLALVRALTGEDHEAIFAKAPVIGYQEVPAGTVTTYSGGLPQPGSDPDASLEALGFLLQAREELGV